MSASETHHRPCHVKALMGFAIRSTHPTVLSQRVVLRPAARALCLDSARRSLVNVAPWGCDLPTRRQPKHRVQIICTPDQWSAREDVQGRAMSPAKFVSDENRAHLIGTLSWHSHQRTPHFALRPILSCMRASNPPLVLRDGGLRSSLSSVRPEAGPGGQPDSRLRPDLVAKPPYAPNWWLELDRGRRSYFTQDQLDIRQRPTVPACRAGREGLQE